MSGINDQTGEALADYAHVQQSLEKIFFTPQGQRVMREWFGNPGLKLLGELDNQATILKWFNITWMLVELFEPRFKIETFYVKDINRLGENRFVMAGRYLPYAHIGLDQVEAFISVDDRSVEIRRAN